jgi:hypothetical protein
MEAKTPEKIEYIAQWRTAPDKCWWSCKPSPYLLDAKGEIQHLRGGYGIGSERMEYRIIKRTYRWTDEVVRD